MDSFLDSLYQVIQRWEGRLFPQGWTATVVLTTVLGGAVLLTVVVALLLS